MAHAHAHTRLTASAAIPKPSAPLRPVAGGGRRVNSPAMASPVRPVRRCLEATEPPRQPATLTDDLLEEVLVRISFPANLARASTACVSFRRLIADPSFLRRYRSLHPPLLLGFLNAGPEGFQPAEAPHPNAPAARAIDRAANFFRHPTQGPRRWDPTDICDGRILFEYGHSNEVVGVVFPDLAVCDPLSRRYRLLPPIPDNIVASVHVQERDLMSFQTFLLPSGSEEDEASFRVIGMAHCEKKTVVFVFSSVSGCWSVGASTKWDALSLTRCPLLPKPHYVYGCFYWRVLKRNKLIKLDMSRMEFSTVDLPPDHNKRGIVIVEAGEGRLGMFSLMAYDTSVYYAIRQREDVGANEWQMENVIPLPVNYNFYIDGAPGGYIFLLGIPKARDMVPAAWFSLEINTLKIQRVSGMRRHYCGVKPYFGFPPSMSPRRV